MVGEVARLYTLEMSSERRLGFEVIAAANKLQPRTESAEELELFIQNTNWIQRHL